MSTVSDYVAEHPIAYDAIRFGRSLTIGQPVVVAWGYGSGFRAMGRARILKINKHSVRVALTERVPCPSGADSWPIGQELSVAHPSDYTNVRLHPNNTVHPTFEWVQAIVGCHWTCDAFPGVTVSTFVRGQPGPGQLKSGFGVWYNYNLVDEFETLDDAKQRAAGWMR